MSHDQVIMAKRKEPADGKTRGEKSEEESSSDEVPEMTMDGVRTSFTYG